MKDLKRIAILGGGPSGLFMFKRLIASGKLNLHIVVFEKKQQLGAGMPYSTDGANDEHITNVSGNEIPEIETSLTEWLQTVPQQTLDRFKIDINTFNDYKVLPRLLFGKYLEAQFKLLIHQAEKAGINVQIHLNTIIKDVIDNPEKNIVTIQTDKDVFIEFDFAVICTGHNWIKKNEGIIPGYFDSPYPPSKLNFKINNTVAIRGSSLTAIDAVRTLARYNGGFFKNENGKLSYKVAEDSSGFRIVMHSRNGLLPAVRFHLDDSHLSKDSVLSDEEININRLQNEGFLSLDYVFEKNFKEPLKDKQPQFYQKIKDMQIEEFVAAMMELRERIEPFHLFKSEYEEAAKSIKRKESVYWKEMLAVLSFTMNYPAKYFSAEDMMRLQKVLMPLISIVIAFVPQSSAEELMALHNAGVLDIISVGDDSNAEAVKSGGIIYHYTDESGKQQSVFYKVFIDGVGQPHLLWKELPYKSLIDKKTISPARLKFRNTKSGFKVMQDGNKNVIKDEHGNYYLNVQGITINDTFQVVNKYGEANERIFIMAVPYIGGYNPDYSGLDFGEAASARIIEAIMKKELVSE